MTFDNTELPRDPGPVPTVLREAFARAHEATRLSGPLSLPDDLAVDALAEAAGDDDGRFAVVEQLLASPDGARVLAHVVAARSAAATADTDPFFASADGIAAPRGFAELPLRARPRGPYAALKPILLAASLMLVAGTSWYVYTLPTAGDEVRDASAVVELAAVSASDARAPITLRWTALRDGARYSVEVLDANDLPIFTRETNDTQVVVPAAALVPGTYRWYVRARGADRSEIRSRVESFQVR